MISISEVQNSNLHFNIWASKVIEDPNTNKKTLESKVACETYISLGMVFKDHSLEKFTVQTKRKAFERKLWLFGHHVGDVEGEISITAEPFLRQLFCGVMTENGLSKHSGVLLNAGTEDKSIKLKVSPKIKAMLKLKDDLVNHVYKHLGKTTAKSQVNDRPAKIKEIKNLLDSLSQELLRSEKISMVSYLYDSAGELVKSQEILISVGDHLAEYSSEIDEELRQSYLKNIVHVLDRGELYLNSLGFSPEQQKEILNAKGAGSYSSKAITIRVQIGIAYQKLLYTVLLMSLEILANKVHCVAYEGTAGVREVVHRVRVRVQLLQSTRVQNTDD